MADERLRNVRDSSRESRGASLSEEDRSRSEPREISDEQRIAAFRARLFQHVLPDLPEIPGYKTIWLSMNAEQDTIQQRESDGYVPVTLDDVPGWAHPAMETGAAQGHIRIREMIAYKLPERIWRMYMEINHHERPMDQDQRMLAALTNLPNGGAITDQGAREGVSGITEIAANQRVPSPWR
jgi:hypothetical protein